MPSPPSCEHVSVKFKRQRKPLASHFPSPPLNLSPPSATSSTASYADDIELFTMSAEDEEDEGLEAQEGREAS